MGGETDLRNSGNGRNETPLSGNLMQASEEETGMPNETYKDLESRRRTVMKKNERHGAEQFDIAECSALVNRKL